MLNTSPSENLVGKTLTGNKVNKQWTIIEKVKKDPDSTGGNFSVGYLAQDAMGQKVFLKASDLNLLRVASNNEDPMTLMSRCFREQEFERAILDICHGNNMDRIVHALDYGTIQTTEGGILEFIFFIVFEQAKGDVRSQINIQKKEGMSWCLVVMQNLSTAINQLHSKKISHNDIKPSNLLVFETTLQKLADLGRATAVEENGPWDGMDFSGDWTYAPPEFFYENSNHVRMTMGKVNFNVRQASDLYLLGSMGFFLLTGESLTPLLTRVHIRPEHYHRAWNGSYEGVLPYLEDALGKVLCLYFDYELPKTKSGEFTDEAKELRSLIFSLCHPSPQKRGHPSNIANNTNQYGLERYISAFDRLSKKMAIVERMEVS